MNRRSFIKSTAAAAAAGLPASRAIAGEAPGRSVNRGAARIAAYYFRAQMYTCVPRQIREDMEWMADKGTSFVCPAILEQDLWAAVENLDLITREAERVGMRILAVPSRWGGLVAGAPKVPSLFSATHPDSLVLDRDGSSWTKPGTSGVMSSNHDPATLDFFCRTLEEMYRQHPCWAGVILDEPKAFVVDHSPLAKSALGENAQARDHHEATANFYSRICAFSKEHWPDKLTILFLPASKSGEVLSAASKVGPLDYFGADGRPWGVEEDRKMRGLGPDQESGKGKILLGGNGEKFIRLAESEEGRRSFFLMENHNLQASMIDPLDEGMPQVLQLPAGMFCYYYYPRNVEDPERTMKIIGRHLRNYTRG